MGKIRRYLAIGLAIAIGITSGVIVFVRSLDKKGKVRLGIAIAGLTVAGIIFILFIFIGHGIASALIKSISSAVVTAFVLSGWLELLGVEVWPNKVKVEWQED